MPEISELQPSSIPPFPELSCPECAFKNKNPEVLADHLIQAHSYAASKAWYVAGQENERVYPRFRAPAGTFSVLGEDVTIPSGRVIATCATLQAAILAADDERSSQEKISIYDDSGKELNVLLAFNQMGKLENANG